MADLLSVDELFRAAFAPDKHRTPRSAEYKVGVRAALTYRIHGTKIRCPYPIGTSKADAFFSGVDEGHGIWRRVQEGSA